MISSKATVNKITQIRKRDGQLENFDKQKIVKAISKAAQNAGNNDVNEAEKIADEVVDIIDSRADNRSETAYTPTVEEIQDTVEKVLIEKGHAATAKAFILYRAKHAEERASKIELPKEIDAMFIHKSKLSKMVDPARIAAYKSLYYMLKKMQKTGEIKIHEDYLGGSELARNIYHKKYCLKDFAGGLIETNPEDVFVRLASFIASVEENDEKQKEFAVKFYNDLYNGYYLPGGRVMAGAGDLYRLKTLANCFVSLIDEDNIESIYKAAYEAARTYSYGGGIGIDISNLRPRDAVVHNAADKSTGAVSFMELYSLTTGLIGQSGRRGALMLTLDVKHPEIINFINVKKNNNWVTEQIVKQVEWSGKFNKEQLEEVGKQVRENTQVRFANISIKVSDEFMLAVQEQTKHGPDKIVVYKKAKAAVGSGANKIKVKQDKETHYSYGMPSKEIKNYEAYNVFNNLRELNGFLNRTYNVEISEKDLHNNEKRDVFGDYVVQIEGTDYDLAIKYSGDFLLYYNSDNTGEIKNLVKARDVWNLFVASNYKTAEPGLIFWTTMSRYSPSNYVGRPISSTNPCVTGDTLIKTEEGSISIKELAEKYPNGGIKIAVAQQIQSRNLLLEQLACVSKFSAFKTGTKETVKIITKSGKELKCTPDHRIMTTNGWKEAENLKEADDILTENGTDKLGSIQSNGLEDVYDITEPMTHSFIANGIIVHNCGEVPLEDGGACNLGSINLSRFVIEGYTENARVDWENLKIATQNLTRFLDNVVTWNQVLNALDKQRKAAEETRRTGLGIMGIADMLNQLGIPYDSDEGIAIVNKAAKFIANICYEASSDIAAEKEPFKCYDYEKYKDSPFLKEVIEPEIQEKIKKQGIRNVASLSIAPTGTISNAILGFTLGKKNYVGVSGGIEPVFALFYTRRSESFNQFFKVFHSTVQAYIDMKNLNEKAQVATTEKDLRGILPTFFFRTAHYIKPEKRVEIQGIVQKYIDQSISSTVNLAEDINPEIISTVYLDAWQKKLKGITIYRDGSRYPILSVETQASEFQRVRAKTFEITITDAHTGIATKKIAMGDEVIALASGALTTPYHLITNPVEGITVKELIAEKIILEPETNLHVEQKIAQKEQIIVTHGSELASQHSTENADTQQPIAQNPCPECGVDMNMTEGCATCPGCGFSPCSIKI